MIFDFAILLLKVIGGLILAIVAIIVFHHVRAMMKVKQYTSQEGVISHPANSTLAFGFFSVFQDYAVHAAEKKKIGESAKNPLMMWAMDRIEGPDNSFDGAKYPMVVVNQVGLVKYTCSDPEFVSLLYNQNNKHFDKTTESSDAFSLLLNSSLAFGPGDEDWRRKRKACAHAFYKDRLRVMLGVLHDKTQANVTQWSNEIKANGGSTEINIAEVFAKLFSHNIIHVAFGENLSNVKFDFDFLVDREQQKFETRKVDISDALTNTFEQINCKEIARFQNPIALLALLMFGIKMNVGCASRVIANCNFIRAYILEYVQKRRRGETKSQVGDTDMLSLFLETPEVFTDEFIVDELMDFFFAATITTQFASQTIVTHLIQSPDSLKRVRDEFAELTKESSPDATVKEKLHLDVIQEMEYLHWVMNEALRYDPPAVTTTPVYAKQDITMGKIRLQKDDIVQVNIYGLHYNSNEWQRPREFLPDRWDTSNKLSLTPAGKKRNPASFAPFSGGARICMGKTFGECNIKIVASHLTQAFDFQHVNKKWETEFPNAHFFQSYVAPIIVRLTPKK